VEAGIICVSALTIPIAKNEMSIPINNPFFMRVIPSILLSRDTWRIIQCDIN